MMKVKRIILGAWVAALAVSGGVAFAQHGGGEHGTEAAPAAHEEKQDVSGFIFHHVADANEFELEIPLNHHANKVLHFPQIWIPIKSGAVCPANSGFQITGANEGGGHHEAHRPGLSEGCLDLSPTKHVMMLVLASIVLVLLFVLGTHKDKNQLVPKGRLANALEMLVVFARDEIAIKNIGKEEGPRYVPYILSVFFFILFVNLWGLVPEMATATGNIGVTAALAAITFVLTQIASIRSAGVVGFLKHLTGGVHWLLWPIMVPVEILGLFTKPFALTMRLFANMVAGHVVIFFLLGLIFIMGSVAWAGIAVPFALAIYMLEIFVAFLQAYIFALLSALFIGMGVAMGHHDHGDAHEHGHAPEGAHSHDHGAAHQLSGG
ncbi:MAG: F0F1 ATP synthase subunit A [Myxococcaceae bacterium]|nr:F0F1 ATP synthase subunit A [Myxococcaceae bacterium]